MMKKYYVIPASVFLLTFGLFYIFFNYLKVFRTEELCATYSAKFQVPLFTGFLTISGFLMSLTAFIIVKMHESVYQSSTAYSERVERLKRIDPNYDHTVPLRELSQFLLVSVLVTLSASFSQFTIGNISSVYATIFCVALASAACVFVFTSCWLVKTNIEAWVEIMKEDKEKTKNSTKS